MIKYFGERIIAEIGIPEECIQYWNENPNPIVFALLNLYGFLLSDQSIRILNWTDAHIQNHQTEQLS